MQNSKVSEDQRARRSNPTDTLSERSRWRQRHQIALYDETATLTLPIGTKEKKQAKYGVKHGNTGMFTKSRWILDLDPQLERMQPNTDLKKF